MITFYWFSQSPSFCFNLTCQSSLLDMYSQKLPEPDILYIRSNVNGNMRNRALYGMPERISAICGRDALLIAHSLQSKGRFKGKGSLGGHKVHIKFIHTVE